MLSLMGACGQEAEARRWIDEASERSAQQSRRSLLEERLRAGLARHAEREGAR